MPTEITTKQLLALQKQVIRNFTHSDWITLGTLTGTLQAIETHPRLLRSLNFGDDDYDGLVICFLKKMIDANPDNYRIMKDILATKGVDSINISSTETEGRTIIFSPSIFTVPDEKVDGNLVSVMMPFSAELKPVYDAIQLAVCEAGFNCQRADNIWENPIIIQDVFSLIFRSYIVVCDFSGKNPNVFYEAGIAHTLGKHVIPLVQNLDDIPFDLRHHRHIQYLNNDEGRKKMKGELISKFRQLLDKRPSHIKPLSEPLC